MATTSLERLPIAFHTFAIRKQRRFNCRTWNACKSVQAPLPLLSSGCVNLCDDQGPLSVATNGGFHAVGLAALNP